MMNEKERGESAWPWQKTKLDRSACIIERIDPHGAAMG